MTTNATCDVSTYMCSDVGLLLPLINEYTWPIPGRAAIYFFALLYSFLGISIIADIFMGAIETITSHEKTIFIADIGSGTKETTVRVWNGTVANLTLMALGSSAPEILLSVIEITGNQFKAGALGPGTIVGSAAFNLLCITGICLMAIPDQETRRIESIKVFAITSTFSVFAYIWLIIILVFISPNYVDVWEAVVTFLMFPVMVILAYIADKDFCGKSKSAVSSSESELGLAFERDPGKNVKFDVGNIVHADEETILKVLRRMGSKANLSEEDEAKIAANIIAKNMSHGPGWYKMNAIRQLTGSAKLEPQVNEKQGAVLEKILSSEDFGSTGTLTELTQGGSLGVVEFAATSTAVLEKEGRAKVILMRHGNTEHRVLVRIETIDGTAEANSDYVPVKTTIVLEPGETSKHIDIEIIDDNIWEPDEVFFIKASVETDQLAVTGTRSICQITILNDDEPGTFEFEKPSYVFKESIGLACVPVIRSHGADGRVVVTWMTKNMTAINNRDFTGGEGELIFEHGEMRKMVEIQIHDDQVFEKDEHFDLSIIRVSEGAHIGQVKRTIVTIMNDDAFKGVVSRVVHLTNANLDAMRLETVTWSQQFEEAMNVNGGDIENAGGFDYFMHFLTFGWKVIFAIVPPPSIWGGWLAFFTSLGLIGGLTAIVGDLAGTFGCLVGLKDEVTSITFVALGTSLPDLFASKQAAVREKYADNSIGNVTGSNSVNVFLGLGLPWLIASIYWTLKGKTFAVPAGSLSFSVVLYTVCALIAIALLMVRRYTSIFGRAELGGPKVTKYVCAVFLIFLWIFYVIMSSLQVYGHIKVNF
ncbi:sodium/calcium exchanger 1 [Patella vulgata]|uniref:sodium/calcium exchanger 1 n=1 Tax=Patella vulgata TaxID=6465 RepID=UPI0021805322|nr:sodium/calcium exchanger 1 [Patella vulgata]